MAVTLSNCKDPGPFSAFFYNAHSQQQPEFVGHKLHTVIISLLIGDDHSSVVSDFCGQSTAIGHVCLSVCLLPV